MNNRRPTSNGLIAAERRRQIHNRALESGSVSVSELADMLGVGPETIRRDLDELDRQGKLIRSHGGAIAKQQDMARLPYSQVRGERLPEKGWIGRAALDYLPATGKVFFGAGSTVHQLALLVPQSYSAHVVTPSPEMGLYLATAKQVRVGLLGGDIRFDTLATDGGLSDEASDMLLFDVALVGVAGIDLRHGITAIDRPAALFERKIIEHSSKVVGLCDSSKIGRSSYAKVGPIDLLNVLITDHGADQDIVQEIKDRGVEVVVVGPDIGESSVELSLN